MIEVYLAEARKCRPASAELTDYYEGVYRSLLRFLKDSSDAPKLHVAYSIDRRSEFLILGNIGYIIHDQYLGQSFNKLNRILTARHGSARLAQSYACKFLAERFVTLGCHKLALLTGLLSRQFEARVLEEGDPYDIRPGIETTRLNLTAVQESFVLAHELAHFVFPRDQDNFIDAVRTRLEEFFTFKEMMAAHDADRDEEAEKQLRSGAERYRRILASNETDYLLELFADDFGGLIALQLTHFIHKVPLSHCRLGLVLAFKYMRLFRHLELMARALAPLENLEEPEAISALLADLDSAIWDPTEDRIAFYQLREHVLRHSVQFAPLVWHLAESDEAEPINVSERVDQYDEFIEFPVVFSLVDVLKELMTSGQLANVTDMASNSIEAVKLVDELTGWTPRRSRKKSAG